MTRQLMIAAAVGIASAVPVLAASQAAPPAAGGSSGQAMVRAAGMALQDGTLAPGSLTVRVVQGDFSGNLAGIDVVLDVSGEGAKRAPTGADGRAAFAHLPIGATVQASAVVNGERLQSEPFTMPAEAGIRLLFVASGTFVDTATKEAAQAIPPISAGSAPPLPGQAIAPAAAPAVKTSGAADGVATFRIVMIAITALVFGAVVWARLRRGGQRR